ncbi:MAG: hypothetical protein IPG92_02680 [Flavobacteriales bacterium]|nr:hypothetical protein [Flavobacteriales bacterium]
MTMTLVVVALCAAPQAMAQTVLDGAYINEHTNTKRVVPYTHIREADVMWARRVWRTIDLREKMNHPFYYPTEPINDRKSLFDVIRQGLLVDGSITAYDAGPLLTDDEFKKPLLATELKEMFTPDRHPVHRVIDHGGHGDGGAGDQSREPGHQDVQGEGGLDLR